MQYIFEVCQQKEKEKSYNVFYKVQHINKRPPRCATFVHQERAVYCKPIQYMHQNTASKRQGCSTCSNLHWSLFFLTSEDILLGFCSQVWGLWSYFWLAQPTFAMTFTLLLSFPFFEPIIPLDTTFGPFSRGSGGSESTMRGCCGLPRWLWVDRVNYCYDFYLCRRSNIFHLVFPSVGLSVCMIAVILLVQFSWNSLEGLSVGKRTNQVRTQLKLSFTLWSVAGNTTTNPLCIGQVDSTLESNDYMINTRTISTFRGLGPSKQHVKAPLTIFGIWLFSDVIKASVLEGLQTMIIQKVIVDTMKNKFSLKHCWTQNMVSIEYERDKTVYKRNGKSISEKHLALEQKQNNNLKTKANGV